MPSGKVTGIGSAIFAFLAAGAFKTIEEAQDKICSPYKTYQPEESAQRVYADLYEHYRKIYFAFGEPGRGEFAQVLPALMRGAKRRSFQSPASGT